MFLFSGSLFEAITLARPARLERSTDAGEDVDLWVIYPQGT